MVTPARFGLFAPVWFGLVTPVWFAVCYIVAENVASTYDDCPSMCCQLVARWLPVWAWIWLCYSRVVSCRGLHELCSPCPISNDEMPSKLIHKKSVLSAHLFSAVLIKHGLVVWYFALASRFRVRLLWICFLQTAYHKQGTVSMVARFGWLQSTTNFAR